MKMLKKMLCAVLVAALLCAVAVPAFAADSTFYMRSVEGNTISSSFYVQDYQEGSKISDVKSSNSAVVKVTGLERSNYTTYDYETKSENKGSSAYIRFRANKVGNATLSYKLDGKAVKKTVSILKYVNPVKTLKLTGVGKANLKSAFAKSNSNSGTLKSDAKAGYLQATPASGWKIVSASWSSSEKGDNYSYSNWREGVSALKLNVPAMKAGKYYYINLTFRNVKTGASIDISYSLN